MKIIPKALGALLALALWPAWLAGAAELATTPPPPVSGFAAWHWPLPAGKWAISRGPCQSGGRYSHDCRYYEERCGVDFVPLAGSMENAPVLAPQAGQVFFMGTRTDAGLMLMVRHPDGRVSSYMHLTKIVVAPEEKVAQGQVLGYAGNTGSSGNPHLHFFVQPNAVERECVELQGLDEVNYAAGWAVSKNLAWPALALPDPPQVLPDWLPGLLAGRGPAALTPAQLLLAPGARLILPVVVSGNVDSLRVNATQLKPAQVKAKQVWFNVPVKAARQGGVYTQTLQPWRGAWAAGPESAVRYVVRPAPDASAGQGIILLNPTFVSPANGASVTQAPKLCWREEASAGQAPLQYRVMAVGPTPADSGWLSATCWQTPALKTGVYLWKVFVRDARGYMNRTNQRPQMFTLR